MPKTKSVYICSSCGNETSKWAGRCPACGEWNTLSEQIVNQNPPERRAAAVKQSQSYGFDELDSAVESRRATGIEELDRVLGGGVVKGSLVLISGDPGIGKSTILLQMCSSLGLNTLYVSGEESPRQLKLRAERLGVNTSNIRVLAQTDVASVCEHIRSCKPELVVVDSIQTMYRDDLSSAPGSVPQVRESAAEFMRVAKDTEIPIFMVGHVNKEGSVAGPKVMEHMVDCVLYFEGERTSDFRILRAIKNRFGSTNEIGVFEMTRTGLRQVSDPSLLFLQGKPENVSGISTVCVMEGSRPIVAEVQALVAQSPFPVPRRVSNGFDYSRLNLLIAVLEKRCGMVFSTSDAYLNVIGGLRLDEPAADLSVAAALASGLKDFIIPADTMLIGEVGLAGEIRAVTSLERRISEAEKLGFRRCVVPARNKLSALKPAIELVPVYTLKDAFNKL